MSNCKLVKQEPGVMRIQIVALLVERDSITDYVHSFFSIVKPTRCTNVSSLFYFGITLQVSGRLSVRDL